MKIPICAGIDPDLKGKCRGCGQGCKLVHIIDVGMDGQQFGWCDECHEGLQGNDR